MLKFDTRDKKPALYDLLIALAVVAVILAVCMRGGNPAHPGMISLTLILFYLYVLIRLLTAFAGQIRYNPYSYNTIYYMGFSLFIVSILVSHILLAVRQIREPGAYGVWESVYLLLDSVWYYMFLTLPFILVFSVLLFVSNVSLIRHEGKRLVNVLGIILAFLLVGGAVFLFYLDGAAAGSRAGSLTANILAAIYLYFECMLIGAVIASLLVVRYEPDKDKDFLIILGCGLNADGTPTPLLRGRIDRALEFYRRQKAETGKELVFVPSGGKGPDEPVPESASMKQYLLQQGIPEERILEEDRSTDTFENMKNSWAMIREADPQGKVAFATTNYHVFRSGLHARRVKMRAVGMGARTRWYFWPNAWVREFVGLVTEHRGKQALILGAIIAAYTVLTLLSFSRGGLP